MPCVDETRSSGTKKTNSFFQEPDDVGIVVIIESSLDKGRGYVATVLVSNGTLKMGDIVLAGTCLLYTSRGIFGTPEEYRRYIAAGKRQEVAGDRSECQLHALPQRRLVLLLSLIHIEMCIRDRAKPMIVVMTNGNAWQDAAAGESPKGFVAPSMRPVSYTHLRYWTRSNCCEQGHSTER